MGTTEALAGWLGRGDHSPGLVSSRLRPMIAAFRDVADRHGVPAPLLAGIAIRESSLRPGAIGPVIEHSGEQALGLMQVTPETARAVLPDPQSFLAGGWRTPSVNIDAGARVLLSKGYGREPIARVLSRYGGFVTVDPSEYIDDVLTWAGALIPTFIFE